jgi:hypothetical protein
MKRQLDHTFSYHTATGRRFAIKNLLISLAVSLILVFMKALAEIIEKIETNKEALVEKFMKAKRQQLISDMLGFPLHLITTRGPAAGENTDAKVAEFYRILREFDEKFLYTGIQREQFDRIYKVYMARLKEIHKELETPSAANH